MENVRRIYVEKKTDLTLRQRVYLPILKKTFL